VKRLLSIQEAADALGYSAKGFRKFVDRSRAKANGARTRGPTIKFFQASKGAPVKFKPEWIEEFVAAHTLDPDATAFREGPATTKGRNGQKNGSISGDFGFDPQLLDV
jgi:hypothetical protein